MLFEKLQTKLSASHLTFKWTTAFILLLPLLPLPFGMNRPWASDLYAVLCGTLLAAMLWSERSNTIFSGNPLRNRLWFSAGLVSIVIVWCFFQIIPWSPQAWHHPLWQEASHILGNVNGSISIDPGVFPESLIRFVSYIATFLLAYTAGRDIANARRLVRVLALAGLAYAIYGILAVSAGGDTILWYKKWAYEGFLTSTFVNKNSYAAYAGLSLLCCLTFLHTHFSNFAMKDVVLAHHSKTAAILSSLSIRDYAYLLSPLVLLAALALTGSRAGVASTLCGGIAFVIALAINEKWRFYRWLVLLIVAAILFLSFVSMGGEALLVRIEGQTISDDTAMRLAGYKLVIQALQDNPWLGFGLGTFDSAFRLYRDASLPLWFHHAHNDYLEMMMDLGIPVALALFTAILVVISCTLSGIRTRRRDGVYPALAFGASVLLGTHVLVDFSFHIPAIAATYAALLGVGVAQSVSSRNGTAQTKPANKRQTGIAHRPSDQKHKPSLTRPATTSARQPAVRPQKPAAPAVTPEQASTPQTVQKETTHETVKSGPEKGEEPVLPVSRPEQETSPADDTTKSQGSSRRRKRRRR